MSGTAAWRRWVRRAEPALRRLARPVLGPAVRRVRLLKDAHEVPSVPVPARSDGVHDVTAPLPAGWFVNPVAEGADPFVVRHGDHYLWCRTVADRGVAVWRSDRLTSLGEMHLVWQAPADGPYSAQVWAPELHLLDGRWHIYVAASDGRNENHLAYVLVADTDDPLGSYSVHGPLNTGDGAGGTADNAWAIDMTVLEHRGRRYALWSGWPDRETRVQHLYIAEMDSPTSLTTRRRLISSPNDFAWERIRDDREEGLNEAPQVLTRDGRTFVVFSCGSALLPSYKLGLLELLGDDPLDAASWRKRPEPLFTSTEETFGVGHGSFTVSPDGTQWWHVYHAKIARPRSFKRALHVQPMSWTPDGEPDLGSPVAAGVPLREPSGTPHQPRRGQDRWLFGRTDRGPGAVAAFDYYGHLQYVSEEADGLHLGCVPEEPVNAYRSGEKVVLRDGDYADARVTTTVRVLDGSRAVGVLFRTTAPAVGTDAQRGYFAGWVPRTGRLVLRRTDGRRSEDLGSLDVDRLADGAFTLVVRADGPSLAVHLAERPDRVLEVEDRAYGHGSIGLRVLGTHAVFTELAVEPARS